MGIMDSLGQSAKGMFTENVTEKAILYIYLVDLSGPNDTNLTDSGVKDIFDKETEKLNKLQKDLLKKTKSSLDIGGAGSALSAAGSAIKSGFNTLKNGGWNSSDNVAEPDSHSGFVKFKVQYNPATIRLYSVNGKVQSRKGEEGIDKLSVYNFSGKSKLSFDLIFDDCDNMDAFTLNEISNINVTSAINKGWNALGHGKSGYSVRKRMDAIMSLLSSAATQQVVFFWANMAFRGTITDVGNKFTMFNPSGNPIRGEMHLELTQDKQNVQMNYDESYWDNAFQKCFKEKSTLSAMDNMVGGKAFNNNFINLNL